MFHIHIGIYSTLGLLQIVSHVVGDPLKNNNFKMKTRSPEFVQRVFELSVPTAENFPSILFILFPNFICNTKNYPSSFLICLKVLTANTNNYLSPMKRLQKSSKYIKKLMKGQSTIFFLFHF